MKEPLWKVINLYRIFPRIALIFMLWMTIYSFNWFAELENPTPEHASVVIAVTGSTIGFGKFYLQKGKLDETNE